MGPDVWVPLTRELTAYTHNQSPASTTWNIQHDLNTIDITVAVYGTDNQMFIPDSIQTTGVNTATVTFSSAVAGRAVVITGSIDGPVRKTPDGNLIVDWTNITSKPSFALVSTTGNYNDLSNKPSLAAVATSGSYADLANTPTLFDGQYSSLTGAPSLAAVATSGSYADLSNKPTINTLVPTQTGNAGKFLTTDGSVVSWTALKPSKVFTVGIDAATIQGCIDLCTNASASNVYAVMIPPGVYTENLTLKGSVVLIGMGNSLDTKTVVIKGTHTFTGSAVQVLDNRFSLGNLLLDANGATTTPHFTLAGTTTAQIDIVGCNIQHTSSSTASVAFSLGSNITLYFIDSWLTLNQNSGTGGTQFSLSSGNLYIMNSVTVGGTRVFEQTGAGYIQTTFSTLSCGGDNAVRIYGNGSAAFPSSGLLSMGWSTLQNTGTNGNGINLLAAGASVGAFGCTFDVLAGASNYVVTGVAGTSFSSANNMYTNIPGILSRNVKIKNTVTALAYTSSLSSSA
jgi:hypothetical protein